jgi:hypothetical protein
MRSTLRDIGPVLTHRVQIIKLALQGKTTSQISQIMHHSPEASARQDGVNYERCGRIVGGMATRPERRPRDQDRKRRQEAAMHFTFGIGTKALNRPL